MATVHTCDGCNQIKKLDELEARSGILELVYCSDCLPVIDKFFKDRDSLHDDIQKMWSQGIQKLQDDCHKNLIARVPDEI